MARSEARLLFGVMEGLHGLATESKVLYIALLVEPTLNQAGIGALRETRWAKETELPLDVTREALRELDDKRYVLVDDDTEEVFVRTLIRNDGVADRPNVLWAACRAAEMVRSPRLRRALAQELRKLPPQPPDKTTKSGGVYVHPDPHTVADKIDPGPPSGPEVEPFANPSRTVPANPSGTLREPLGNPPRGEPFGNHWRTPGGGGGGGGEGSPPVATHVEIKTAAASRARARDDAHDETPTTSPPPSPDRTRELIETAGRAVHATIPTAMPTSVRRQLIAVGSDLLAEGTPPDVLTAGLVKWREHPHAGPRLLPHLVADVIRERAGPGPARRKPTTDQRVEDILALKTELCGTDSRPPRDLFALPGGAA